MKIWRIWDNHLANYPHFKDALEDFIKQTSSNTPVYLALGEECEVGGGFDYSRLSKFKNVDAVVGAFSVKEEIYKDFSKYCNLSCWPNFWLYKAVYTKTSSIIETKSKDIKYLFTCMNNRPHTHRAMFMDMLAKYNLLSDNKFSWHNKSLYEYEYWNETITTLDGPFVGQQTCFPPQMYESVIDIVTESVINFPFITEKTYNAILFKKPFIVFGYPGLHNYLESVGYKLNRSVINYDFDHELDDTKRADMIASELQRLSKYNLVELFELLNDSVEYNYNLAKEHVLNQFGVPDVVLQDNYYYNTIEESKRICKLDL